jgi:hypothetical protein
MKRCFFLFLVFLMMLFAMLQLDQKETAAGSDVAVMDNVDTTHVAQKIGGN